MVFVLGEAFAKENFGLNWSDSTDGRWRRNGDDYLLKSRGREKASAAVVATGRSPGLGTSCDGIGAGDIPKEAVMVVEVVVEVVYRCQERLLVDEWASSVLLMARFGGDMERD